MSCCFTTAIFPLAETSLKVSFFFLSLFKKNDQWCIDALHSNAPSSISWFHPPTPTPTSPPNKVRPQEWPSGSVREHLMLVLPCIWLIDNGIRRWRNRSTHISRSVSRSRLWGAFSGAADLGHAGADAGGPWETAGQRDVALAELGNIMW